MVDLQQANTNSDEMQQPQSVENSNDLLIIGKEGKSFLLTSAKWSKFIAIVGFAMIAVMLSGSLGVFFISPVLSEYQDFEMFQYLPMPFYFFGIFYILMAVIYFIPYYYLYGFSIRIKKGIQSNDQVSLNEGLKKMKQLSAFIGIVTIISLSLLLLMIPVLIFSFGMIHTLSGGTMV